MINRRVITIALVIANLCLFVIYVSAWIKPAAQNKKTVIKRLTLSKEPVEVSLKLKGQPLKTTEVVRASEGIRSEEFEGDPDWLKDLTLMLRNTSDRTITYIELNLHFPEVTRNGRTALHQILLGVDPDRKSPRAELRLKPNETIEIPLSARYDDIKTLVETAGNQPLANVAKVWVEFHSALFDDGMLFQAGTMYTRNPDEKDSRKWIKIANP